MLYKLKMTRLILLSNVFLLLIIESLSGQNPTSNNLNFNYLRTITTMSPFLIIPADAKNMGSGFTSVSNSAENYTTTNNIGQTIFNQNKAGVSVSNNFWLRNLVPDMNIYSISGFYKINQKHAISGAFQHFKLGLGSGFEQAYNLGYSTKLSRKWGFGLNTKLINFKTRITGQFGTPNNVNLTNYAADIGLFYQSDLIYLNGKPTLINWGLAIKNIGPKFDALTPTGKKSPLPTILSTGATAKTELNKNHAFSYTIELNKLLVASPPVYLRDANGNLILNPDGTFAIGAGKDPNRSMANTIFTSFFDAPGVVLFNPDGSPKTNSDGTYNISKGSVFKEEIREITIANSIGYTLFKHYTLRLGHFFEHRQKGGREFTTLGLGWQFKGFHADAAIVLRGFKNINTPAQNSLCITLGYMFKERKT